MADGVTLKVEGLAELERKMRAIGPKMAGRALRSALTSGAQVIKREAAARAPVKTGRLAKKAIYIKRTKEKGSSTKEAYIVGVRHGHKEQKRDRDAFYWTFLEFGTKSHAIKARNKTLSDGSSAFGIVVQHPGFAPIRFMQRAFESKKFEAFERIRQKLRTNLDKFAKEKA